MTPCQKIKRDILLQAYDDIKEDSCAMGPEEVFLSLLDAGISSETVDICYDALIELDLHWDYESEFRHGDVETKLPTDSSRHYESKAVASKLSDGTWVGWTYWFGGGKHGEPGRVEWMEDAYNLEVTETEKLVLVREFKKI